MKKQRQKQEWKPFLRLLREAKIPWGLYIFNLAASMLLSTVLMRMPWVAGQIMAGEIFDRSLVITYIVVMPVSTVVNIPLSLLSSWTGYRADRNLRRIVWKRIVHMPQKDLDRIPPTSMVSRVTNDTASISYGISYCFDLVSTIYSLGVVLVTVWGINHQVTWMMLLLIPFIILACIPSHFMHAAQDEAQNALARYTNFLSERLSSIKQIKAFNAEEDEDRLNDAAAREYFKANVRMTRLSMISEPLIYSMDAVVQAIVLVFGGYLLSQAVLTSEDIVTLFMYAGSISVYAYQFVFFWQALKQSQGAARTASQIVETPGEVMERKRSFSIPDADIRLENVSFAYENGQKVLDDLSLVIPKGKTTAIVGPSGSGKTTVLKLLERLYQPSSGRILFGDIPAEDIHLNEWRESFGMVPQNSPLLFGTIRDNILYGVEEKTGEKLLDSAVEKANVQEILNRLPDGILSDVGDVGSRLSGGEKQRIALARMMIRDPEYLILDEATSALDAENEHQITEALQRLMEGRTSVVVAHSLRTIEHADHIIFLENGKVQASGTHGELLRTNPTYQRYVELQKGEC